MIVRSYGWLWSAILGLTLSLCAPAQSPWTPVRPRLAIAQTGTNVTVSWLVDPFQHVLESATSPSDEFWTSVDNVVTNEDSFSVASNAKNAQQLFRLKGPAAVPLFQFAMFGAMDMEISPGPPMLVTGPVHGNSSIYITPGNSIAFRYPVTAAGSVQTNKNPVDPTPRPSSGVTLFNGRRSASEILELPIRPKNPQSWRQILEIPPWQENPDSELGRERLFNKADLVIIVSNSSVRASSGRYNNFATVVPWVEMSKFLRTNEVFLNRRENKTVVAIDLDVNQLRLWNSTNKIPREIRLIYIADMRAHLIGNQAGVRLVNGLTLPSQGLTVATPNPLYVQGHYNVSRQSCGHDEHIRQRTGSMLRRCHYHPLATLVRHKQHRSAKHALGEQYHH